MTTLMSDDPQAGSKQASRETVERPKGKTSEREEPGMGQVQLVGYK